MNYMNNMKNVINCGKIAYDILHDNFLLKNNYVLHLIYTPDQFYQNVISDAYSFGIFSIRLEGKMIVLPEFLVIYDNGEFTPFEYLAFQFVSKYTRIVNGGPPLLPATKIYMKEKKRYTVKDLLFMIKEIFSK